MQNEEVKESVSRNKDAYNRMCRNSTANKNMYESMRKKAEKVVSNALREKDEDGFTELKNC